MVFRSGRRALALAGASVSLLLLTAGTALEPLTPRNKAFYAPPEQVAFVRPGLNFQITGAGIAADGTIRARLRITDPRGLPLDRAGVETPGNVNVSMIAAVLPRNQQQYTSYTTRVQQSPLTGNSATQAVADSGGAFRSLGSGVYEYTFATRAPQGFDRSATHTIGAYGNRDLSEFDLGTNYASTTFSFVPDGSPVTHTRDVVRDQACNACHDQIAAHGGSRRGVALCVLCHTPQTTDPDTGNTVDMTVMTHRIHMGAQLPSVQAGTPYRIIGFRQSVHDYSDVVHPADPRRCESCHRPDSGAAQATAHLTRPTRAACGSCHDDVNFATGEGHVAGPQISDNLCANCHIPQGELDFDASARGSHVVPEESSLLSGLAVTIDRVSGGSAGSRPTVTFSVKDRAGRPLPLSQLNAMRFTMAGPTSDYGQTNFGSDVDTPGYVTEDASNANCGSGGACTYQFVHPVPAGSRGTFSIAAEARRSETVLAGTTKERSITYGARNPVAHFSVDGSVIQPRRTVVTTQQCNACHAFLSEHGALRNEVQYCVMCHNPQETDSRRRPDAQLASDRAQPPQGVNFNLLIHRIHAAAQVRAAGQDFEVVGFRGSHNEYSHVRYPAMSPQGSPGDTRNCAMCHVNGSEQNLPGGLGTVRDPQGPIDPVHPVTSSCTGCHVTIPAASHALANTTTLGESCETCHRAGAAFSVGKVHAQF